MFFCLGIDAWNCVLWYSVRIIMEKTYTTTNASDMHVIATEFVTYIQTLPVQEHALVVALTGDLGAGKTTFMQHVAGVLGITETITSPTFVILKKYLLPQPVGVFTELVHIDAYRLVDEAELEKIRFNDYYNNPHAMLCIEWPEIVPKLIPENAFKINITHTGGETREVVAVQSFHD